jgi:glutathione S-transferase
VINLHYWPTPNGHKITLFLEESGLAYRIIPVNIGAGEQFTPEFLAISPNNRMPVIVDVEPADGGEPTYLAGHQYTIADMAAYPWIVPWERQQQDLNQFVALKRWFEGIASRPATQRAYAQAAEFPSRPTVIEETRKVLFGQTAASTEPSR